jgi:hypothetical protein
MLLIHTMYLQYKEKCGHKYGTLIGKGADFKYIPGKRCI